MGVANYKTLRKISIDEVIKNASKADAIIYCVPLEHYNHKELKYLTEKLRKSNYVISLKCERSNFYQGTLIQLIKREDIEENHEYL